jgi:hypothetical protein
MRFSTGATWLTSVAGGDTDAVHLLVRTSVSGHFECHGDDLEDVRLKGDT